jgi:hypothetical protein
LTSEEEQIDRQPVTLLEIGSLRLSGSPRLGGPDPEHVEAILAVQDNLPPILVHRPTMRVIDGIHRVEAAIRRGERMIAGRFYDGSEAEAFVLSVSMNVAHGLPLSLADRKRAAERIATSHPQWSDRRVAAVTGISPGTVADIRRRVAGAAGSGASRIGQDGRVRPLDYSAGRLLAGQLMTENPNLSLRQVAKAASISPETARDVRNRLFNGAALVPDRRGSGTTAPADKGSGTERRPLSLVRSVTRPEPPVIDRTAVVSRLLGDPALRYTENGRNLLRLMTLHTRWTEEWDNLVSSVPPHCADVVAGLARQFADLWTDLATRTGQGRSVAG